MNKRTLYHLHTRLKPISPWYFLALALFMGFISIYALRMNNMEMIRLRERVYSADKSNGDVTGALKALQAYVVSHMNTDLASGQNPVYPPVQLKYTYERLVAQQKEQAGGQNTQIYSDAQVFCQQQNPNDFSGRARVPCVEQYVREKTLAASKPIPDALYKYSFLSPKWSPDFAGWSLVITGFFFLLFVGQTALLWWLKRVTR